MLDEREKFLSTTNSENRQNKVLDITTHLEGEKEGKNYVCG